MKKTIYIEESVNSFGDNTLHYKGECYNMFQHNCAGAKELLKRVKKENELVFVVLEGEETTMHIKPIEEYLREIINLDADNVGIQAHIPFKMSKEAEIMGHYGY